MTDTIDRTAIVRAELDKWTDESNVVVARKEYDYGTQIVVTRDSRGKFKVLRGFMIGDNAATSCDVNYGEPEEVIDFLLDMVVL